MHFFFVWLDSTITLRMQYLPYTVVISLLFKSCKILANCFSFSPFLQLSPFWLLLRCHRISLPVFFPLSHHFTASKTFFVLQLHQSQESCHWIFIFFVLMSRILCTLKLVSPKAFVVLASAFISSTFIFCAAWTSPVSSLQLILPAETTFSVHRSHSQAFSLSLIHKLSTAFSVHLSRSQAFCGFAVLWSLHLKWQWQTFSMVYFCLLQTSRNLIGLFCTSWTPWMWWGFADLWTIATLTPRRQLCRGVPFSTVAYPPALGLRKLLETFGPFLYTLLNLVLAR